MKLMDQRERGLEAERRMLVRLGAEATPGSGSWVGKKGDGRLHVPGFGDMLVEVKSTEKDGRRVTLEELRTAAREAGAVGRSPLFVLVFCDALAKERQDGAWVMLRMEDWTEVCEELEAGGQAQRAMEEVVD